MPRHFGQGTTERLDYKFDFAAAANGSGTRDWLPIGDTIESYTIDEDDGITLDDHDVTDDATSITVWLTGGTANQSYNIRCHIVTVAGREAERVISLRVH